MFIFTSTAKPHHSGVSVHDNAILAGGTHLYGGRPFGIEIWKFEYALMCADEFSRRAGQRLSSKRLLQTLMRRRLSPREKTLSRKMTSRTRFLQERPASKTIHFTVITWTQSMQRRVFYRDQRRSCS